ncbi:MAG: hypothetical protein HKN13_02710 [Rhodothermales bacterium]|nr:hypothetical protein [Rhodothermales bacterium]
MKITALALILMLLLSACSDEEASTTQTSSLRWEEPENPDIQFYIATPIQQVTMRPSEGSWRTNERSKTSFSTDQRSEFPYSVEFEYEGTESGIDHYIVKITSPSGKGTQTLQKKIRYQGSEIELFRDDDCQIGVRQQAVPTKS